MQSVKAEGFPTDLEEKESYFMNQVAKGEGLCSEGTSFVCLDVRVDRGGPRQEQKKVLVMVMMITNPEYLI